MIIATVTVDDASLEAGIELQRAKYNAVNTKATIDTPEAFVTKLALDALETYKVAAFLDVKESFDKLAYADIADLAATIKQRAEDKAATVEVAASEEVKP